jgi:hypothetical protein
MKWGFRMTIIYGRNDLIHTQRNKPIGDIDIYDLKHETAFAKKADVVLFRDRSGRTKILKNRYGDDDVELYIEVQLADWIIIR